MARIKPAGPEPIAKTLGALLDRFDKGDHFDLVRVVGAWPGVAGEHIARRSAVVEVKFHTAVIRVSTAMWLQELSLMKTELLQRLQAQVGSDVVRDLRFVLGRLKGPSGRRLRSVPRLPRQAVELPELHDEALKRAFASLIEAWGRAAR
jgi:predicted nucleic acid-binding Zn ribbon protein